MCVYVCVYNETTTTTTSDATTFPFAALVVIRNFSKIAVPLLAMVAVTDNDDDKHENVSNAGGDSN